MKKVRIAVVGAGKLGGFHSNKIAASDLSELVGIYDPCTANAELAAKIHGVPVLDSLEAVTDVADGVVIAAPTTEHARIGLFFLERGKHLLMEKPLAVTGSEADALRAEAARKDVVLLTGHTERFNPAWHAARPALNSLLASGPVIFDAVRTSPYSFRCTDVGVVLDVMIHDLELVLSVVNAPVVSVNTASFSEFGGYEDTCCANVLFENGSCARFLASRAERGSCRKMNIYGRGGRIFLDFASRRAETVTADPAVLRGEYAPEKVVYTEMVPQLPDFMKTHYPAEIFENDPIDPLEQEEKLFAELILAGDTAPRDFGAEAVKLAERILQDRG